MDALKLARQDQRLGQDADDDAAWRGLLVALRRHDWVVYAKPALNGPAQVLDYLGRYTHKTAISNERLIDMRDGDVLFRVRDNANPGKKRIERLPVETFIKRFLSHVLPTGFKRIRHYGILASCHKRAKLAQCRAALGVPQPEPCVIESMDAFMRRVAEIEITQCTCCVHGHFRLVGIIAPQRHAHHARGPPP